MSLAPGTHIRCTALSVLAAYHNQTGIIVQMHGPYGANLYYTIKWDEAHLQSRYKETQFAEYLLTPTSPEDQEKMADQQRREAHALKYL